MNNDAIYSTNVIRSQAETIELQEKEIERLNKRIEDLNIINEEHNILNKMIRKQLQQKENIIKEVREYVYKMFNIEPANSREYDYHCGKLAEILDKENK